MSSANATMPAIAVMFAMTIMKSALDPKQHERTLPLLQRKIRSSKVSGKDEFSAEDIEFQVNEIRIESQQTAQSSALLFSDDGASRAICCDSNRLGYAGSCSSGSKPGQRGRTSLPVKHPDWFEDASPLVSSKNCDRALKTPKQSEIHAN